MVDTLNRPEHSPEDLPYRTELSGILRDSVEAVREEPDGSESLARALESARDIGQRKPKRRFPWTRRLLIACGVAAAVLVLAVVLWRGDSQAWAQVVAAVGKRPWMHGVVTHPDGTKDGMQMEFWFSAARGVKGAKIGGAPCWEDYGTKTRTSYDSRKNRIVRVRGGLSEESDLFYTAVHRAFLSGSYEQTIETEEYKLVREGVEKKKKEGDSWLEYRFGMEIGGVKKAESGFVYVNPDTRLPFRWDWLSCHDGVVNEGANITTTVLDYPDSGPADIYALGVPKDAEVLDLVVDSESPDFTWWDTAFKTAATRANHYEALAVHSFGDQHWSRAMSLYRIWRDGKRWKIDHSYGLVTDSGSDETIPDDADREAWWRRKAAKVGFRPEERSDGRWLWEYDVKTRRPTPAEIDRGSGGRHVDPRLHYSEMPGAGSIDIGNWIVCIMVRGFGGRRPSQDRN